MTGAIDATPEALVTPMQAIAEHAVEFPRYRSFRSVARGHRIILRKSRGNLGGVDALPGH